MRACVQEGGGRERERERNGTSAVFVGSLAFHLGHVPLSCATGPVHSCTARKGASVSQNHRNPHSKASIDKDNRHAGKRD